MKTFKQYLNEDYNHSRTSEKGIVRHIFKFKHNGKSFGGDVFHDKGSSIGYATVTDEYGRHSDSELANTFGPAVMRKAIGIVKNVTGLKTLKGPRMTGAGKGRVQKI